MNAKSLAQMFSAQTSHQQTQLLAVWAHVLTIDARDTYIAGTEAIADPVRLRGFNEIQHRLAGQLRGLLESNGKNAPDEIFMGMLLDATKTLRAVALRAELEKLAAGISSSLTPKRRAG